MNWPGTSPPCARAPSASSRPRNLDPAIIDELRQADIRFHIVIIGPARNKSIKREVLRLHIVTRVLSLGRALSEEELSYTV